MRRSTFALWLVVTLAAGCSTHEHSLVGIRADYFADDLAHAEAKIDKAMKRRSRDADVLKLDRATVLLSQGKPREAEQLLREVRDRFDHLGQKDAGEFALSMLTDDQRLAYPGEDYEQVLVRVFLALADLMDDGGDAGAYALQVNEKQREIIERGHGEDGKNPKEGYKQVAVGAYLHAALREETHLNYDDAARSLQLVCDWAPEFAPGQQDLERVKSGRHSEPGHGVLYVLTMVGRGPYKEERMEIATTAALFVADRILSATGRHTLPPNIAPIKVPRVVVPHNEVQSVGVAVDGLPKGLTQTVTDVGRMAKEQCDALLPYVIGRAVARRVVKSAIIYGAKEVLKPEKYSLPDIALMAAGVAWEATESADTRCWGLLPEKIQVLRVELPAGTHQLALQAVNGYSVPQGPAESATIQIEDGRNTYVLAGFPTGKMVGQVVTNRPANQAVALGPVQGVGR